jgi:hypothetical protein
MLPEDLMHKFYVKKEDFEMKNFQDYSSDAQILCHKKRISR